MSKIAIINGRVITPEGIIDNGVVVTDGSKIVYVGSESPTADQCNVIDAQGGYVMSGGIDLHVHGGGGRDFLEGTEEAFAEAIMAHRRHGTTAIMPTLAASDMAMVRRATEVCQRLMEKPENGIVGLHIEGPYFNPKMVGGLPPEAIVAPDPEQYVPMVEQYSCIRRWDAAPELPGTDEFARAMTAHGVIAALGHTQADYRDVERGHAAGFSHATHFYNAMSGNHKVGPYKHEGTVEAVYLFDDITVEMVADGIHVPAPMLRLVWKVKGAELTALVTDAIACAAAPEGAAAFDPRVIVEGGVAMLSDRSAIAGSVATFDRLIRTCVQQAGIPIEDVSRMASATPARIAGVDSHKGTLEPGKDADIIVMTPDLELMHVMAMGSLV